MTFEKEGARPEAKEIKFKIDFGVATKAFISPEHPENQDAYKAWQAGEKFLFVVADGVGGVPGGKEAAHIVTTHAGEFLKQEKEPSSPLPEILTRVIEETQKFLTKMQQCNPPLKTMCATFAGLLIQGEKAAIGNAGDTRIYLKRENELKQLSIDHTVAQVMRGYKIPETKITLKDKGTINQAMGMDIEDDTFKTLKEIDILPNDIFIIMTDGAYSRIEDEISSLVKNEEEAQQIAGDLLTAVKTKGLADDATVVVIKIS